MTLAPSCDYLYYFSLMRVTHGVPRRAAPSVPPSRDS